MRHRCPPVTTELVVLPPIRPFCRKCGGRDIYVAFDLLRDRLDAKCRTCGFRWDEPTWESRHPEAVR